jgi:hypothetical protein
MYTFLFIGLTQKRFRVLWRAATGNDSKIENKIRHVLSFAAFNYNVDFLSLNEEMLAVAI